MPIIDTRAGMAVSRTVVATVLVAAAIGLASVGRRVTDNREVHFD
jgi:hypothetical protein